MTFLTLPSVFIAGEYSACFISIGPGFNAKSSPVKYSYLSSSLDDIEKI